jgi:hypothetical protein
MAEKENAKGCYWIILILSGLWFLTVIVQMLIGFLFGGETFETVFVNGKGDVSVSEFRYSFWTLVVAIIVFYIAGGRLSEMFKNDK